MKSKIFLALAVLLLAGATANVTLDYQGEVMMLPNSEQIFYLPLETQSKEANLKIDSYSELDLQQKETIQVNGQTQLPLTVTTKDIGVYPIYLNVSGRVIQLDVRVTDAPNTLARILDHYKTSLAQLKEATNGTIIQEVNEAEAAFKETNRLYEKNEYYQANEKLGEFQELMKKAWERVSEEKLEKERTLLAGELGTQTPTGLVAYAREGSIYILLGLLAILVILTMLKTVPYLNERESPDFKEDISSIRKSLNKPKKPTGEKVEQTKSQKPTEMDLKQVENKIDVLKGKGTDVRDIEIWLKLSKESRQKGRNNIAERYLDKVKERLGENIDGKEQ